MKSNNRSLLILSLSLIIVMLGFGMVIPIFPFYIENLGAGGFELGMLASVASILEFLFGPVWGNISDRTGRKLILLIGMTGYAISTFLFGISTQIWMLFASRAISGVLSSAVITTAMAFVSDVTDDEERADGMGKLSAAMAFGMIFGPALGGLLGGDSIQLPFFIASGLSIGAFMVILLFLPESLKQIKVDKKKKIVFQLALKNTISLVRGDLGFIFLLVTLYSFALSSFESVFGLYTVEKYAFDTTRVGIVLAVVAIVSAVGKALLSGPTTKRFGEVNVIKGSLILGAVGYLSLLINGNLTIVLLTTAFFVLSKTLLRPSSLALISKRSGDRKGAMMGAANSFMSIGRILGPIWAGAVFDIHINLPYLSGALFLFLAFLLSSRFLKSATSRSDNQLGL